MSRADASRYYYNAVFAKTHFAFDGDAKTQCGRTIGGELDQVNRVTKRSEDVTCKTCRKKLPKTVWDRL